MNLTSDSARRAVLLTSMLGVVLLTMGILAPPALAAKRPSDQPNQSADVSLSISDTPDPALLFDEITYSVTVYNAGPASASVALRAELNGAGYTSVSPSQGSCTQNGLFYCPLGTMAARASALVTFKVRPARIGQVWLSASAETLTSESDISNNSKTEYTSVAAAPVGAAGCGLNLQGNGACQFLATGGPISATVMHFENMVWLRCYGPIPWYCWLEPSGDEVGVSLKDPTGRVVAECMGPATCNARSSETVIAGTLLTCTAYETASPPVAVGAGAFACTG